MDSEPQLFLEPIKEFLQGITGSPLSAIAETFLQIVPESVHFQVALNVLLPFMNDQNAKTESRIQATFLLWYLYRNHSLDMNPFQATFRESLNDERSRPPTGAGNVTSKALQSTLDMILSGQAAELLVYSPETLVKQWPPALGSLSPRSLLSMNASTSQSSEPAVTEAGQLLMLASETVLSLQEQRSLLKLLPTLYLPFPNHSPNDEIAFPLGKLDKIVMNNPGNAAYNLLTHIIATSTDEGRARCYSIIKNLPPTLATFDLLIRLIKDQTPVIPWQNGRPPTDAGSATGNGETVGYLVRLECLLHFADHCDAVIQSMEIEEGAIEGSTVELDPEGTCALAIQHFSKFCTTLLRMSEEPQGLDMEGEMGEDGWFGFLTLLQSFALRNAKYEGPSELYRVTARAAQSSRGRGGGY